jgi:uncharacterized protein (TIGR02452 family)
MANKVEWSAHNAQGQNVQWQSQQALAQADAKAQAFFRDVFPILQASYPQLQTAESFDIVWKNNAIELQVFQPNGSSATLRLGDQLKDLMLEVDQVYGQNMPQQQLQLAQPQQQWANLRQAPAQPLPPPPQQPWNQQTRGGFGFQAQPEPTPQPVQNRGPAQPWAQFQQQAQPQQPPPQPVPSGWGQAQQQGMNQWGNWGAQVAQQPQPAPQPAQFQAPPQQQFSAQNWGPAAAQPQAAAPKTFAEIQQANGKQPPPVPGQRPKGKEKEAYLAQVWKHTDDCVSQGFYMYKGRKTPIPRGTNHVFPNIVGQPAIQQAMQNLAPLQNRFQTHREVVADDIMKVGRDLAAATKQPVLVQNAGDTKNPGGGVKTGADALEEKLSRGSTLQQDLAVAQRHNGAPVYPLSQQELGTVIITEGVPFFRRSEWGDFEYVDDPAVLSVGTVAAPDFRKPKLGDPSRIGWQNDQVAYQMIYWILFNYLYAAAMRSHTNLVLCALGNGVFQNKPEVTAKVLKDLLDGPFKGVFQNVKIAMIDPKPNKPGDKHPPRGPHNPNGNLVHYQAQFP